MAEVQHRFQEGKHNIQFAGTDDSVTWGWKKNRGKHIDSAKFRLCGKCVEGVQRLASECKLPAGNEYLMRHNDALKVLMTTWAVSKGLLEQDQYWYKLKQE